MSKKMDLTLNPVPKTLSIMTFNMIIGMLSMVAFNLADTYFIGKLGTTSLAAIGFTLPIVMIQGAIAIGLGVGVSAVIAHAIGKKKFDEVQRLTTDALSLSLAIVILIATIGIFTINPVFKLLGANPEQLLLIHKYIFIWYLGLPFVVIPMVGNSAIRAAGNTFIPSMVMLVSVGANMIFDPLLIFGWGPVPPMGLQGAAIATVISRSFTFIAAILFLRYKFNMLTTPLSSMTRFLNSTKRILYVGAPSMLTQLLMPLSMSYLIHMVARYGENAVAAIGVSNRIELFALAPMMAFFSIVIPFTGQNFGANRHDRVQEAIRFGILFSTTLGFIVCVLFILFSKNLAGIFTKNPEVISIVQTYLTIVSIGYALQGISGVGASTFSALQKPLHSAGINLLRLIAFLIPLSYIGSMYWGLKGLFTGILLSTLLSGSTTLWLLHKTSLKPIL